VRWRKRDAAGNRSRLGKILQFRKRSKFRAAKKSKFRFPKILRPWKKVGVLLIMSIFVIGGRDVLGFLGVKLWGHDQCKVTSVVDGDTVRATCPGKGLFSARLVGFDTPEVYSPKCFSEWWAGTKATWALRKRLWLADEVKIVLSGTDRYNRRLATLFVDGTNVSSIMIAAGHARRYAGGRREGWCS
jgi:endonuclease YncB( thermonuclease family)